MSYTLDELFKARFVVGESGVVGEISVADPDRDRLRVNLVTGESAWIAPSGLSPALAYIDYDPLYISIYFGRPDLLDRLLLGD